jgi:hypothetical protein
VLLDAALKVTLKSTPGDLVLNRVNRTLQAGICDSVHFRSLLDETADRP